MAVLICQNSFDYVTAPKPDGLGANLGFVWEGFIKDSLKHTYVKRHQESLQRLGWPDTGPVGRQVEQSFSGDEPCWWNFVPPSPSMYQWELRRWEDGVEHLLQAIVEENMY